MPDDAEVFLIHAGKKSRDIFERDDRDVETIAEPDEPCRLHRSVNIQDAGEESARGAFETSLERLGLDYLDLYLIHQPFGDVYGSWRAMQSLNREGRARAVGVSNFHMDRLVDLIDHNEIAPAVNQSECHPYFQRVAIAKDDPLAALAVPHLEARNFALQFGAFQDPAKGAELVRQLRELGAW